MNLDPLQLKMCDIQGRLFELSGKQGYSSECFIQYFMNSQVAAALDQTYDRLQWAGEEYMLEEFAAEAGEHLKKEENAIFHNEILFWSGYIYRYWTYLTGESSRKIYRQAPALTMKQNYLMFHSLDPEIAIEDLKEIYEQKRSPRK